MICSNCGKREVEVLIKQVINQEVHNLNLCRVCAEEMGFISPDVPSITISFSMGEAEAQGQKKIKRVQPKKADDENDLLTCPSCETEYGRFKETGLLGCPKCYAAFRFPLGAYLQYEQGAESHWGGSSDMFSEIGVVEERGRTAVRERLNDEREANVKRLQAEMVDAISGEEYERAAELRDILRPLLESNSEENDDS